MRKIVSMLFALGFLFCIGGRSLAQASDNFGELNIKVGGQGFLPKEQLSNKRTEPAPANSTTTNDVSLKTKMKPGFSGTLEYLILGEHFGVDFLKVGVGGSYLHKRGVKKPEAADAPKEYLTDFSTLIPVYLTLQINPFVSCSNESLHGIFIKGNLGYDLVFKINDYKGDNIKRKRGVMYGGSVGYEFPFGLIADIGYNAYKFGNTKLDTGGDALTSSDNRFTYSTVGINIGYKFKI